MRISYAAPSLIRPRRHPVPCLECFVEMAVAPTDVAGHLQGRFTGLEHKAGLLQLASADVAADGLAGMGFENRFNIGV